MDFKSYMDSLRKNGGQSTTPSVQNNATGNSNFFADYIAGIKEKSEQEKKQREQTKQLETSFGKAVSPTITSKRGVNDGRMNFEYRNIGVEGSPINPDTGIILPKTLYDSAVTQRERQQTSSDLYSKMEQAKKKWEDTDDITITEKMLNWVGGLGISPKEAANEEYKSAAEKYYQFKYNTDENLTTIFNSLKRSPDANDETIKKDINDIGIILYGVNERQKREAESWNENPLNKDRIAKGEIKPKTYGYNAANEWIDTNVNAGIAQYGSGAWATLDATIGNTLKALGWENNPISTTNKWAQERYGYWAEKSNDIGIAIGDKNNWSGKIAQGLIGVVPDAIMAVMTAGASTNTSGSLRNLARLGVASGTSAKLSPITYISAKSKTLADAAANTVTTAVKNPLYWTSFVRTFGSDYNHAKETLEKQNGSEEKSDAENVKDEAVAYLYAIITSSVNAFVEMSGGIQTLPAKLQNKSKSEILQWIISAVEEGSEEVIQGVISELNEKIMYNSKKSWGEVFDPARMGEEFVIGTAVGGIAGGGQVALNSASTSKYVNLGKTVRADGIEKDIISYARKSADENIRNIALDAKNGKISNKNLGILYNYVVRDIDASFNSVNDIEGINNVMQEFARENPSDAVVNIVLSRYVNRLDSLNLVTEDGNAESIFNLSAKEGDKDAVTKSVENVTGNHSLTEDQKKIKEVGKTFGVNIEFKNLNETITITDPKTGKKKKIVIPVEGYYDEDTNTVVLNNSGHEALRPMEYIVKHELTHSIEVDEGTYALFAKEILGSKVFVDYVTSKNNPVTSEKFKNPEEFYQYLIDHYARMGKPLGEGVKALQKARSEAIANFVGDNLFSNNSDWATTLIEEMSPKARLSFVDWVKNVIEKLKMAFRGRPELTPIEEAERRFIEAAQKAKKYREKHDGVSKRNRNAAENKKTTTEKGDGVSWLIGKDVDGNYFADIREDIFDETNGESVARTIQRVISKRFDNLIKVNGQKIQINKTTNDEFRMSESARELMNDSPSYNDKLKTIANADEIIKVAKNWIGEKLNHPRKDDIIEFARGNVNYRVGNNGYTADVIVGIRANGAAVLYDLVNIYHKNIKEVPVTMADENHPQRRQGTSSKNSLPETTPVVKENVEKVNVEIDEKTESASPRSYSLASWEQSDYVKNRNTAAQELADALGITQKKAKDYIDSINSVAKVIADDRMRLDYVAAKGRSTFVSNAEYGGSVDCSTLCPKRKVLTGTFSAIQKALKNSALTAEEILDIRNRMKEKGLEVSCGLCYVEDSRAQMGKFSKEFIERYKKTNPEYVPDMFDINTPEGVEQLRIDHPEVYEAYEKFWNNKGVLNEGDSVLFASQQKPKLYQTRTDYKGEILNKFKSEGNVVEKNKNGGLRLQSFSDFEIVHLIDMMQVVMDMSRVGLAGQAYTKVPDFALALGNTGLKINLSLIAKGVDADGSLIFDDVEGMPIDTAMRIRDMYSDNVGTILVVFNDAQLKAALADNRVDFIIPFHRSQWKKALYEKLGLPKGTKDYTYQQNEKYIKPVYYTTRNGTIGKRKATNYMPLNDYWDFTKSGKENAEAYLKKCAEENKRPKFYKLLVDNKDGSYSLQPDGSTDGYWKLLIDFKMYNNDGVGVPQQPVKPEFNMDEALRMLDEYKGGHQQFPVDQETVDDFVKDYKAKHKMDDFVENEATESKAPDNPYKGFSYSLPDIDAQYLELAKDPVKNEGNAKYSLPKQDSQGRELSKGQQKYFKDSVVRDENGNLLVVYHGTREGGWTVPFGDTFWFSNRPELSETYSESKGKIKLPPKKPKLLRWTENNIGNDGQSGLYEVYLNLKNPLVVEGNGAQWSRIKFKDDDGVVREHKTRYIAEYAQDHGYDGVIFTDIIDSGYGEGTLGDISDVYVAFKSNQIKDVNNTEPTTSKDIRYSIPETSNAVLLDQYENGEITREEYLEAIEGKKKKAMNPTEIANLTEEDADTTPNLPAPKMKGDGDGESKLYGSLLESGIITDDVKTEIANDTYIKNYGTTTNKAELAEAAEKLEKGGAKEVKNWVTRKNNISAVDVAEGIILLKQYQDAGNINGAIVVAERLREIASLSGQVVQAFSIIGRFTPEMMVAYVKHELSEARSKMVELKTEEWVEANKSRFELTDEEIRTITDNTILASELQDGSRTKAILLGEITTMLQNKLPPEKGQAMRAWMRTSLLFNVKTQLRNILGNATMVMPYIGSDFFGGLVDKAISTKTGVRTTGFDAKIFGKSFAQGMKKGAAETIDDYKRKIHTKQEELDRFETGRGGGKSFSEMHTGKLAKQLNAVARALNEVDRLNSMLLELGDRPFFESWFANELNTLMKLNKTDTPTKEMVEQAKQVALQRTWQDNNKVTKAASGLRKALNFASIGGYGLGDVVLKFVKTPANIAKAMFEFSPVGFAPALIKIKEMNSAIKRGKFTPAMQKETVRSLSNAVVGTAIYLIGYALIAAGKLDLSGGGDDDKDVSNFEKYVLGVPPYSFDFFGTRVTYTWNQPLGTVVAVVAEIMDESKKGDLDEWDVISTVGEVFTSQSFLQNLYEFFSKDDALTGLASLALSEPSAAIPTLFSQIASLTDPYRRTSYESGDMWKSALNDVIYRLPVLRQLFLDKQVNTLGEENKNPQFLNPWFAFIDPSTQYPKSSSLVAQNIYELYEKTGDKTVMPRVAPYNVTIKGKTVNFSIEERNEIQRQMGTESAEILGKMFASAEFKKLSDNEKTKAVAKVYEYAYAKMKAELDIYDYETLSQMVGTNKNGDLILSKEKYNRLSNAARQMLVDEYFFSDEEIRCKGDPQKLSDLFIKRTKK